MLNKLLVSCTQSFLFDLTLFLFKFPQDSETAGTSNQTEVPRNDETSKAADFLNYIEVEENSKDDVLISIRKS